MHEPSTSYYPPRARWYSPALHGAAAVRRQTHLDRLRLPSGITPVQLLAALMVPGCALLVLGKRTIGRIFIAGYFLAAVVFVVWLGYPIANLAGAVMLSLHVTSVLYFLNHWLPRQSLQHRIAIAGVILLALSLGLYLPLRNQIERHLAMPLKIRDQVVVVRASVPATSVKRGDQAAYRMDSIRTAGYYLAGGYGLGVVLGVAGDQIEFSRGDFRVNGVAHPRRSGMPQEGVWVVPEKHWFIWPDLGISMHGHPTTMEPVSQLMIEAALVPESAFVGKLFGRWFWKRQVIL